MKFKFLGALVGAAVLAGVTAPAMAQDWRGGDYRYDRTYDDRAYDGRGYDRGYDGHVDDLYGRGDYRRERVNDRWLERRILSDRQLRRAAFPWLDRDRDYRLDGWEVRRAAQRIERIADVNRDGRVSRREYDWARERILQRSYASRW